MTRVIKIHEVRKGQYVIFFICDDCGALASERKSHFMKKKRHFCNRACYSNFRKTKLPKKEQHAYKGGGLPLSEKKKRIKARSDLNHAITQHRIKRGSCQLCCDSNTEGHHTDYNKPLDVVWLCFKCHRKVHENPELLK